MPNCCICGNYVPEGEDICPTCMEKASEPCITCRLPWTSEEQFELMEETNDFNRGSV